MKAAGMLALVAVLALSGCACVPQDGAGEVVVRWHTASLAEINDIRNAGMTGKHRKSVWGCCRRSFNQCTVYTAHPASKEDPHY